MNPSRTPYPTDVSEDEWAFVAAYLTLLTEDAGQHTNSLREVFRGVKTMQKFVRIILGLLAILGVLLSLAACQSDHVACNVSVVEMASVRGIAYLPGNTVPGYNMAGRALTQVELGPVFDTINTAVGGCSQPTQGNFSTFLPAGTILYTLKGYPPSFRLAVKQGTPGQNQPISLLEALSNPHASKGSELMQLDHVTSMLLYPHSSPSSSPATPPLAAARSLKQVAELVALFDHAPVRATNDTGSTSDFLVLRFSDGTLSSLVYDPTTGWTNRNVILPATFASLLTSSGSK
jgi:hypothetical protein